MATPVEETQVPIVITEDDARGAEGPEDVPVGDTLVPMLIGGLVMAVIGIAVALLFFL